MQMMMAAVNLTGNWMLDKKLSDSLQPLIEYHQKEGYYITPTAGMLTIHDQHSTPKTTDVSDSHQEHKESNNQNTSSSSSSSTSSSNEIIPALIFHHSRSHLATYQHGLIPHYDNSGTIIRYDSSSSASDSQKKLPLYEDYLLDGQFHEIINHNGQVVESRAYVAPHGQSLVIDTRCASKYDLERSERFLDNDNYGGMDGKTMVIEIRILTTKPNQDNNSNNNNNNNHHTNDTTLGVSQKFLSQKSTPDTPQISTNSNNIIVRELLFIKLVFKKIIDAGPSNNHNQNDSNQSTSSSSSSSSSSQPPPLSSQFDAALDHHSPLKIKTLSSASSSSSALSASSSSSSSSSTSNKSLPSALACIAPSDLFVASSSPSMFQQICQNVLYPRHCLLKHYPLTHLITSNNNNNINTSTNKDSSTTISNALNNLCQQELNAWNSSKYFIWILDIVLLSFILIFIGALQYMDSTDNNTTNTSNHTEATTNVEGGDFLKNFPPIQFLLSFFQQQYHAASSSSSSSSVGITKEL